MLPFIAAPVSAARIIFSAVNPVTASSKVKAMAVVTPDSLFASAVQVTGNMKNNHNGGERKNQRFLRRQMMGHVVQRFSHCFT
jgi:hypothetical protein